MADPFITVDDVQYPLVQPDDMTMREQREFEKIAGAGADKLTRLETDFRAGLLVAWMAVSIKRAKPGFPIEQIVNRLDELKTADMEAAWAGVAEAAGQSPPEQNDSSPESSEAGSSSDEASGPASESAQANGSQSATGSPPSEPSLASVPQTSET